MADFTIIEPPEVIDYLSKLGAFLTRNTDPFRGTRTAHNR